MLVKKSQPVTPLTSRADVQKYFLKKGMIHYELRASALQLVKQVGTRGSVRADVTIDDDRKVFCLSNSYQMNFERISKCSHICFSLELKMSPWLEVG